jgi:hypothetical protein
MIVKKSIVLLAITVKKNGKKKRYVILLCPFYLSENTETQRHHAAGAAHKGDTKIF